tara:strand:+ start:204 stop:824 length:621 start_codon:yes stop_codon:yes gene_type:complete
MKNNPIKTFNSWAEKNKDAGMEKNHSSSVNFMLQKIPSSILSTKFSFLDLGCGNGWVVRKMNKNKNCIKSVGIDGAENMIKKATNLNPELEYIKLDLDQLNYNEKFNIVFSMEVFYYLKDPLNTLKYIYTNMINHNGFFIMGIDHYLENKPSLKWPKDLDLDLHTMGIEEWVDVVKSAGFDDVKFEQVNNNESWAGTLVIYAQKKS